MEIRSWQETSSLPWLGMKFIFVSRHFCTSLVSTSLLIFPIYTTIHARNYMDLIFSLTMLVTRFLAGRRHYHIAEEVQVYGIYRLLVFHQSNSKYIPMR